MIYPIMDIPARRLWRHHLVIPPMSLCRVCIEFSACLSDGYSAHIKALLFPLTCSHIWRSLLLDSTDALPVAGDCFFADSWNKLSLLRLLLKPTLLMDMTGRVFSKHRQGGANRLPPFQKIAPLHCTGPEAMRQIKEVFGDRCLSLGAGSQLYF